MSYLLNIDTATEKASVCVSKGERVLAIRENALQKEHASFIHEAIRSVVEEAAIRLNQLDAVAVTSGPGSYTGLRVGMATAKGLCYALNKPLITCSTLAVMAIAAIKKVKDENALYCPMIDARRMEVFTAVFDKELKTIVEPQPLVIDADFLKDLLNKNRIIFFGSGALKFKQLNMSQQSVFENIEYNAETVAGLAYIKLEKREFADIGYAEPEYLKAFYYVSK